MTVAFGDGFGNPHSSEHSVGWRAAEAVDAAALAVASLVGADRDEVIFTSGATEANNLAILGLADFARKSGRRRIIMSAVEHKSALAAGRAFASRVGCEMLLVGVNRDGFVDLSVLHSLLDDSVLCVSVMAVNNEIGTIEDMAAIGRLARDCGALLHCDAAQAPCAFDTSALFDHVDLLSLSAHKIYGPSGIGALVARRDVQHLLSPLIYGGGQQNGLRSGTVPHPLCVGFGAAAKLAVDDDAVRERERVRACRDLFVETLTAACWPIEMNGAAGIARHPGNANLLIRGIAAADLIAVMQPALAASSGSACTSGIAEPSHVLRAMGLSADEAECSVRFSFGRFTTDDDARDAARIVDAAISRLSDTALRATA